MVVFSMNHSRVTMKNKNNMIKENVFVNNPFWIVDNNDTGCYSDDIIKLFSLDFCIK